MSSTYSATGARDVESVPLLNDLPVYTILTTTLVPTLCRAMPPRAQLYRKEIKKNLKAQTRST